ncbi:MAG: DUF4062 domain-containing protein [Chloroflexi bacterium]|nr:DUF4062 domain-containing protein [Chloroflexota bacterium]
MASTGDSSAPLVFVSSTVEDFRDLRSALRFWLDSLGYRRFMSEFSGSEKILGPGTYDACFEAIHRADLYVLLIGIRRGSLISEEPKRSITEAEYDVAYQSRRKTGRPKLLFFVRDEVAGDIRRCNPELKYQDFGHTRAFIDKVERVAETNASREGKNDPPADNWLHCFKEFADIATEIDSALGITGTVREARQRDLIREELAEILQKFVGVRTLRLQEGVDTVPGKRKRIEETVGGPIPEALLNQEIRFPDIRHRVADDLFGPLVNLDADQMGSVTLADSGVANRIASFSMVARAYGAVDFPRLDEASRIGVFRRYDAKSRTTVATDLQRAVDHAQRALQKMQSNASDLEEGPTRVISALAPLSNGQFPTAELPRIDVVYLAGLHNAVHNAFVRLVALLRALQGAQDSPLPKDEDLRPTSPFPGMDKEVARERATSDEILEWASRGMLE